MNRLAFHTACALSVALAAILLLTGFPGGGPGDGREGNRHYAAEAYEEATAAYQRGLSRFAEPARDDVYAGLQNNLGAALHQLRQFEDAGDAFAQALLHAPTDDAFTRSAYNAGNTAFQQEEREAALDFYRRALLADPTNADARYNYEFVKREMDGAGPDDAPDDSQEDEDGTPEDAQPEPAPPDIAPDGLPDDDGNGDADGGDDQPGDPDLNGLPDQGGQVPGDGSMAQDEELREQLGERAELSPDEARRILQALQLDELDVLRDALRRELSDPQEEEKDW